jgi:RNA recognition motif-containing protein
VWYAPPDTKIRASVVSGKKGKLVGHVKVGAEVNGELVVEILRGKVVRGRLLAVEFEKGQGAGAASTSTTARPASRSQGDSYNALPPPSSRSSLPSPTRCGQFYVENLDLKAHSTDVKAAFLRAVDHELIKSVIIAEGGGSAIVTLAQRVDLEAAKEKMKGVEINGRKLVVSSHEVVKEETTAKLPVAERLVSAPTSERAVLTAIRYRPSSTAPVAEKLGFPLSTPRLRSPTKTISLLDPLPVRADASQPISRPASRLSERDRGRSPVRSSAAANVRRLSPTSAAGIVYQKSLPPGRRRDQRELDQWASEASFGRFPADYFPYPPPAVLAEASESSRSPLLKTGWRT